MDSDFSALHSNFRILICSTTQLTPKYHKTIGRQRARIRTKERMTSFAFAPLEVEENLEKPRIGASVHLPAKIGRQPRNSQPLLVVEP